MWVPSPLPGGQRHLVSKEDRVDSWGSVDPAKAAFAVDEAGGTAPTRRARRTAVFGEIASHILLETRRLLKGNGQTVGAVELDDG